MKVQDYVGSNLKKVDAHARKTISYPTRKTIRGTTQGAKKLYSRWFDIVDDLMTKTIMLAYMVDNLIKFLEDYKKIKKIFEAIKARYDANNIIHV